MSKVNWLKKESEHYKFYFLNNSLAQKDIDSIIREQEKWYEKIIQELKIKNKKRISYYLYPSRELKKQTTQDDGNAFANWNDFSVHTIYNEKLKILGPHEDTHLLTLSWGISISIFREGLAEFLHKTWHDKSHNYWSNKFFQKQKASLTQLINSDFFFNLDPNLSYPVAGSLVKFLIKNYGLEKFKKVYGLVDKEKSDQENIKNIEKIYQISLEDLEKSWKINLK
jgi:hypothetical protein